jgi:hypothetical protein
MSFKMAHLGEKGREEGGVGERRASPPPPPQTVGREDGRRGGRAGCDLEGRLAGRIAGAAGVVQRGCWRAARVLEGATRVLALQAR